MTIKTLRVDDKWSIEYDPNNNDRPLRWFRYGEKWVPHITWDENNAVTAMFYALLEERAKSKPIPTPMTIPWEVLSRSVLGAARDKNGFIWAFWKKPVLTNVVWSGFGRRIDNVIPGIDPGTCDWKDSWIENPLYEGERA